MGYISSHVHQDDLGSGRFRNEIRARAVAYRRPGSGVYVPMDTDWKDGLRVEEARIRSVVGGNADITIMPIPGEGAEITIGAPRVMRGGNWQRERLSDIQASRNKIGTQSSNLVYNIHHNGYEVKTEIALRGQFMRSGGRIAFAVDLGGFSTRVSKRGIFLSLDGKGAGFLKSPFVRSGDWSDTVPVAQELATIDGQTYLVYEVPDISHINDPVIDPTYSEQPDEADAEDTWIDQDSPTANRGNHGRVFAQLYSAGRILRTLFRWDLSSIPSGVSVDDATMSLFTVSGSNHTSDMHDVDCFLVLSANTGWTEGGATWNTRDGSNAWEGQNGCGESGTDHNATSMGAFPGGASTENEEKQASLTPSHVESMIENNHGMIIRGQDESSNTHSYDYAYSSNGGTASLLPKMVIDYTEGAFKPLRSPIIGSRIVR